LPGTFLVAGDEQIIVGLVATKVPAVPSSVKRLARSSRISLRWGATLAKLRDGKMLAQQADQGRGGD